MILSATISGIGFWANHLPNWHAAQTFAQTGQLPEAPPKRPAPSCLPANERRRAPDTVLLALDVAEQACNAANANPQHLPSVFASTHGELAITDYMGQTLATDPRALSPIKFHNSVHNAAAGYWTIGTGCHAPTTAVSAHLASFSEGLQEALVQLATGTPEVLLVVYDGAAHGPLTQIVPSTGLLAAALVLRQANAHGAGAQLAQGVHLRAQFLQAAAPAHPQGRLTAHAADNAAAPMLPFFDALATEAATAMLFAGPRRSLYVELGRD